MGSILDALDDYEKEMQRQNKLNRMLHAWSEKTKTPYLLIGITGHAKSGKDTAVNAFMSYIGDKIATKFAFADPIKSIGSIFGFTDDQMTNQSRKEVVDDFWGITPRKFMQLVGTEMFRNHLDNNCWIRLAERKIDSLVKSSNVKIIFITDVRFENEVNFIKQHGIIWKIQRPSITTENVLYQHASETYVDKIEADNVIINDFKTVYDYCEYCNAYIQDYLSKLTNI